MKSLDRERFSSLLKTKRVKLRLARELRFIPESITHWEDLEMLAIGTRSNTEGLLLIQVDDFYMLPYELTIGLKDKATGRSKPITCDFCYTWQQGGKAGRITFRRTSDDHTFTYLCCADLRCSLNVRDKTAEALLSRTQLHEDLIEEQRVARLDNKLRRVITMLGCQPVIS
jgi:hypothetical protein